MTYHLIGRLISPITEQFASATNTGGLFQIDDISSFEDPSLYQAYAHGPEETITIVDDVKIEEP